MATIADELNAISVEHGYTGAAPKTIAGAIDALADTLAGTDVEERRTIAGAVKALAPYIGGGGGTTLGSMQYTPVWTSVTPVIGGDAYVEHFNVLGTFVGDQQVTGVLPLTYYQSMVACVAAGTTVKLDKDWSNPEPPEITAYVVTYSEDQKYTSVTPWDGSLTHAIEQVGGYTSLTITLTVPELDASAGEMLAIIINFN